VASCTSAGGTPTSTSSRTHALVSSTSSTTATV
jgi:hypothetical protein